MATENMRNFSIRFIVILPGFIVVILGLQESVSLVKFWLSVRHSLEIFRGDILFLSWILFQTLFYLVLAAMGIGLILTRPWVRIPAILLLFLDFLLKVFNPPVIRSDIFLGILSLCVAVILVTGPLKRLYQDSH